MATNYIPQEIIEQILTRVPGKALFRFRYVSKSWLSLITSPSFVKSHLNFASNSPRILSTFWGPDQLKHCPASSLISDLISEMVDIEFPESGNVLVLGSCNGLLLVSNYHGSLFIWNPCTQIYKRLLRYKQVIGRASSIYGFGYNESDDDYKVFGIFFVSMSMCDVASEFAVYSSRTNSWKRVRDYTAGVTKPVNGCFLVGKFHFRTRCRNEMCIHIACDDIVSFDLGNEIYQTIEQPDYGEGGARKLEMGVLNGCICVIWHKKTCADLWVMKEYGVKESWTNTHSFPYLMLEYREIRWYKTPLVMLPSGEILLAPDFCFAVYDPKNKTVWVSGNNNRFTRACVYVESLVSPIEN